MAEHTEDWDLKWELLVADAWADPALKQRLLSDPAAVCAERGIVPPPGVNINVVEDTDSVVNLVLPPEPSEEELSEEELETVAGGHHYCVACLGCFGCGGSRRGCRRGCSSSGGRRGGGRR